MKARKEKQDIFDLDALLHPASAFAHPMEVVHDPDLTLNEKRAILAWASDASALEAAPDLRVNTSGNVVHWDDIMDALRILDRDGEKRCPTTNVSLRERPPVCLA
jgi:hypothetical protein